MYEQLKLDNQLCFRLYSVSRLVTQAYRPLLAPLGLTYPQYLVLMVLWEHDGQPVSDICHRLLLDTNTLTPLLQRMERQGLLVRTRGIDDARQRVVSLTDAGRALEQQCKDIPTCLTQNLKTSDIRPADIVALMATLDQMIGALVAGSITTEKPSQC